MLSTSLPARLFVLAALTLGLTAAAGAQEKKTLKLQDTTSYTQQPIVFGVEKGFFAEEGLNVEFVGTQDPVTATSRGDVTFAFNYGPESFDLTALTNGPLIIGDQIVDAQFAVALGARAVLVRRHEEIHHLDQLPEVAAGQITIVDSLHDVELE